MQISLISKSSKGRMENVISTRVFTFYDMKLTHMWLTSLMFNCSLDVNLKQLSKSVIKIRRVFCVLVQFNLVKFCWMSFRLLWNVIGWMKCRWNVCLVHENCLAGEWRDATKQIHYHSFYQTMLRNQRASTENILRTKGERGRVLCFGHVWNMMITFLVPCWALRTDILT